MMSEATSDKLINSSDFAKSFMNGNNDFNNKTFNVNHKNSFKKASRNFNNNAFDVCAKCHQKVYQMERVGPVNQVSNRFHQIRVLKIFHVLKFNEQTFLKIKSI